MVFRFTTSTILALLILSFSTSPVNVPHERETTSGILPSHLPLAAVNGPQRTIVITVQFPDKGNGSSPRQILTMLSNLNNYYNEDSYGTVSFQTGMTPPASSSWYTLPNVMTYYGADTVSIDSQLVSDSLQAAYNAGVDLSNYKFAIVVHSGDDEAMTHVTSDIHSFTIPGYVFNPAPLISYKISTSVVAESDPTGVYCHEAGHLLGLPDLYDLTGQIDPANNFLGYWEIMALGEWNPNNGNPLQPKPGAYPSHHSIWSKIQLGFVPSSRIAVVQAGQSANITVQDLETPTVGTQSVKIPIAANQDGSLTYYLVEMRAKIGTYDQYLPFPSDYPGAGILIYKVNESIPAGHGSVRLIDAHPGGDLSDAPFGPCNAPCVSNNTFSDQANFVKVIVTTTSATSYSVLVDRTSAFFLEPLAESLVPVLHVRSDRGFDPFKRVPEILSCDILGFDIATERHQTGFADNRLEICARVASCLGSHVFKVNFRGQGHVCSVDLKNLQPCCDIRCWHKDQPIESSRAQDSRIDDIWSVGRANYYNVLQ